MRERTDHIQYFSRDSALFQGKYTILKKFPAYPLLLIFVPTFQWSIIFLKQAKQLVDKAFAGLF